MSRIAWNGRKRMLRGLKKRIRCSGVSILVRLIGLSSRRNPARVVGDTGPTVGAVIVGRRGLRRGGP